MGSLYVPDTVNNYDSSGRINYTGMPHLSGSNKVVVDIDKLSAFLAKYVVKEDLIEE